MSTASVRLTLPTGLTLLDWAAAAALDLGGYGLVPRLDDPGEWQLWGAQLAQAVGLGARVPNPYNFNDWKEWAERLAGELT